MYQRLYGLLTSVYHCRQLRKPAHLKLCSNQRQTRSHFAVQVCTVHSWNTASPVSFSQLVHIISPYSDTILHWYLIEKWKQKYASLCTFIFISEWVIGLKPITWTCPQSTCCILFFVCFRLQSPERTGRRNLLLETRQERAVIWWMRLKKVSDIGLWPLTSDILRCSLTDGTKLTMSSTPHFITIMFNLLHIWCQSVSIIYSIYLIFCLILIFLGCCFVKPQIIWLM